MLTTSLALALFVAPAPPAFAGPEPATVPAAHAPWDAFEDLVAEFDAAYAAWREEYSGADRATRKALKEREPATMFWARFVEMGDAGEGRALLWQLDNLRKSGMTRRERETYAYSSLLVRLVNQHRESDWFGDVIVELGRRAKKDGDAELLLSLVANSTENATNRGHATVKLGDVLLSSKDEAKKARGKAMLEQAMVDFKDTEWADAAEIRLVAEQLAPGNPAPDFTAKTIDDYEFKLSDYKGKVVLLDFYGFW